MLHALSILYMRKFDTLKCKFTLFLTKTALETGLVFHWQQIGVSVNMQRFLLNYFKQIFLLFVYLIFPYDRFHVPEDIYLLSANIYSLHTKNWEKTFTSMCGAFPSSLLIND